MSIGIWQLIIILVIVLLLFGGRGKISSILGDLGKGFKSFKDEITPEEEKEQKLTNTKEETKKDT